MVTFPSVQCHPGLTYILIFDIRALWLSTLITRLDLDDKCNQLTPLRFKGLMSIFHRPNFFGNYANKPTRGPREKQPDE